MRAYTYDPIFRPTIHVCASSVNGAPSIFTFEFGKCLVKMRAQALEVDVEKVPVVVGQTEQTQLSCVVMHGKLFLQLRRAVCRMSHRNEACQSAQAPQNRSCSGYPSHHSCHRRAQPGSAHSAQAL